MSNIVVVVLVSVWKSEWALEDQYSIRILWLVIFLIFQKAPFSQSGLEMKEFIVDVIPALLPFCMKEFIDFGFQVSIQNPEIVGGGQI